MSPRRSKRLRDGLWRGLCSSARLAQGFLHGVTVGCVLPSSDTRQLRQCENRQSLFLPLPLVRCFAVLVSREVCADVFSSAPTEQRNQNITAGRRWCSCNYAVMSTGVSIMLHYNSMGETFRMVFYRCFNDHCYISCSTLECSRPMWRNVTTLDQLPSISYDLILTWPDKQYKPATHFPTAPSPHLGFTLTTVPPTRRPYYLDHCLQCN